MGNNNAQGRLSARRVAGLMATLGLLVMSSGLALMVTATPANAAKIHKSYVCKYVKTPGSETEQLQTGNNPIWVDNHSLEGSPDTVKVGDKFNDAHGYSIVIVANTAKLNPEPTLADCTSENPPPPLDEASATVSFTDPTCAEPSTGSITKSADQATFVVSPDKVSYSVGDSVTVTASADAGAAFADGATTEWHHTFKASDAVDGVCSEVSAPVTASVSFTEPTCASPSAGFAGTNTDKVSYAVTSGSVAPGADVVVTASAKGENTLGGQTTFPHKFAAAPTNCSQVAPPQVESSVVVSPPKAKTPKAHASAATVTPTVVEAGLGTSAQDLRGEQGLALMVAGMVMLVLAGGLGLRVRGAAARI